MQATRDAVHARAPRDLSRWVLCVGAALAAHAAGAAALISPWGEPFDDIASAPVIVVELAPVAVAPETTPTEVAPGPQQMEAAAEPVKEPPVEHEQEAVITASVPAPRENQMPPEPLPAARPESAPRREPARVTTAPSPANRRAQRPAALSPGAVTQSAALPSWRSALVSKLERSKRYPSDAAGARGVAVLAFNIDRQGRVHQARISKSSGSSALDRETLALASRAQPLPPPPAELTGAQIPIAVPLRYNMD
jgi:periplasmic protein TonB